MRALIAFGALSVPGLAAAVPCTVDTATLGGPGLYASLGAALVPAEGCTTITIVDAYLNEQVSVTTNVTINGAPTTLDGAGGGGVRVMDIAGGVVALNDLLVVGGNAGGIAVSAASNVTMSSGGAQNNVALNGGGIYVAGDLILDGARILDNDATGSGGGVFVANGGKLVLQNDARVRRNTAAVDGGGVRASGEVGLNHSDITNNDAGQDGGGIAMADSALLNITASLIDDNVAARNGGGIHAVIAGPIDMDVSAMRRNSATAGEGGAIYIDHADTHLDGCTIRHNTALAGSGGAIWARDSGGVMLTLDDSTISENAADAVGGILLINTDTSEALINASTIELNLGKEVGGIGGVAVPVEIIDSIVQDNDATVGDAGGIAMTSDSALLLRDSFVAGNTAIGNGGGLFAEDSVITVQRSAIGANSASLDGGGLFADGGELVLLNSTVGQNTAGGTGGGIDIDASSNVQAFFSTIIDNDASVDGNQLRADNCDVNLHAVAIGAENITPTGANDCSTSSLFTDDTHDLDGTCTDAPLDGDVPGPSVAGAPLGLPTFSGGAFAPVATSRLNAAVTVTPCPAQDQLGTTRPAINCTVGAVE